MWTCPKCNRSFKNTHQDHSCLVTDLESHFFNKQDNIFEIFEIISTYVLSFDSVRMNSVKGAILFRANSTFLAVKPKKTHIDIEYILDDVIDEFPVYKVVQTSKKNGLILYGWKIQMRLMTN